MPDYIPREVLTNILVSLTAEDLVRCTAVCKEWYTLIRSPRFISMHLERSMEDKERTRLLFRYQTEKPRTDHYSLRKGDTLHEYKKFTIEHSPSQVCYDIVGSCNGLVCFLIDQWSRKNKNMAIIWNPMIRKAISVPRPDSSLRLHSFLKYTLGFGFDSVTKDYKIVSISCQDLQQDGIPYGGNESDVQVYSLKKGFWRNASDKTLAYTVEKGPRPAYVCGAAHWIAFRSSYCKIENLIAIFDMNDEITREMPVPESVLNVDRFLVNLRLEVYEESILLFHHFCRDGISCTIWVMKEYGLPDSWARQFKVDIQASVLANPLGVRSNGELLFASWDGKLFSYDCNKYVVSNTFKRKKVYRTSKFYLGACTDSLVLLDKGTELCDAVAKGKGSG